MISKHKEQLELRLEKMQGDMFMQNKNVVSLNSYVANYLIFTIILCTLLADLHSPCNHNEELPIVVPANLLPLPSETLLPLLRAVQIQKDVFKSKPP